MCKHMRVHARAHTHYTGVDLGMGMGGAYWDIYMCVAKKSGNWLIQHSAHRTYFMKGVPTVICPIEIEFGRKFQ